MCRGFRIAEILHNINPLTALSQILLSKLPNLRVPSRRPSIQHLHKVIDSSHRQQSAPYNQPQILLLIFTSCPALLVIYCLCSSVSESITVHRFIIDRFSHIMQQYYAGGIQCIQIMQRSQRISVKPVTSRFRDSALNVN